MLSGAIWSGNSPLKPSSTARSVPCPCPVSASDPYRFASTRAAFSSKPSERSPATNAAAALIGPTVCELEGPIPILNISNKLVFTVVPQLRCYARKADKENRQRQTLASKSNSMRFAFGEAGPRKPSTPSSASFLGSSITMYSSSITACAGDSHRGRCPQSRIGHHLEWNP